MRDNCEKYVGKVKMSSDWIARRLFVPSGEFPTIQKKMELGMKNEAEVCVTRL